MKANAMNNIVVMMRTDHRNIVSSIESGSNPIYDLIRPATFDVGMMTDIQLRLPN